MTVPDNMYSGADATHRLESVLSYVQIGADIDGEAAGDQSGFSVSLSEDGTTVAIGAFLNAGNDTYASGHVRVYRVDVKEDWIQIGADIDGEAAYD